MGQFYIIVKCSMFPKQCLHYGVLTDDKGCLVERRGRAASTSTQKVPLARATAISPNKNALWLQRRGRSFWFAYKTNEILILFLSKSRFAYKTNEKSIILLIYPLPPHQYGWKRYAGSDFRTPGARNQAKWLVVYVLVKKIENIEKSKNQVWPKMIRNDEKHLHNHFKHVLSMILTHFDYCF